MDNIKVFFRDKLTKDTGLKIIVGIGILGMALILISSFLPDSSEKKNTEKENSLKISDDFVNELKEQLEDTLSSIEGVGDVNVMLTVNSSDEYIYAEEKNTSSDTDETQTSEHSENNFVVIEQNGNKEALVQQILKPEIKGVVVICEGGSNASVCEKVYKAVSTALNIPTSKIYVTKLSK